MEEYKEFIIYGCIAFYSKDPKVQITALFEKPESAFEYLSKFERANVWIKVKIDNFHKSKTDGTD